MTAGTEKDINDLMFGNSTSWWNFSITPEVRGRIVAMGKTHKREIDKKTFQQKDPLYWQPDNTVGTTVTDSPVFEPVLTLITPFVAWEGVKNPGDAGDDDSVRKLPLTARSKKNPGSVKDAVIKACIKAKSKAHVGDYVEVKRVGGAGNPSSPYMYEAVYYPAATPPKWAGDIVEEVTVDDAENLFD